MDLVLVQSLEVLAALGVLVDSEALDIGVECIAFEDDSFGCCMLAVDKVFEVFDSGGLPMHTDVGLFPRAVEE